MRVTVTVAGAVLVLLGSGLAWSEPAASGWNDVPALATAAATPVAATLRACVHGRLPLALELIATPARGGSTNVAMPMPPVGQRGLTPEERCLLRAVPTIALPPLPEELARVGVAITVDATGVTVAADPAWDAWRDLGAAIARVVDRDHRAALATCAPRARTVRLILDRRHDRTRVWLPAWQFHSPSGDGTTPPAEQHVKACLTRAIAAWKPAVLPAAMGELELAIPVSR